MPRTSTWLVAVILGVVVACSSEAPDVTRRGGPLPGSTSGASGGGAAAPGGDAGNPGLGGAVPYCEALEVVRAKCQRCHTEPPRNGAPFPLLSYEDFQVGYGASGLTYAQKARRLVEEDTMPYVALNDPPGISPPVEPLTAEEKATLLAWLDQGAQPEGGTECP